MKKRRNKVFQRESREFEHKNGVTTHVSRREEIRMRKNRKKGLIK